MENIIKSQENNANDWWAERDKLLQNEHAKAMLENNKMLEQHIAGRRAEFELCKIHHNEELAELSTQLNISQLEKDELEQEMDDMRLQHKDDLSRYDD